MKAIKFKANVLFMAVCTCVVLSTSASAQQESRAYEAYQQSPIHEVARKLIDEVENPQSKAPFSTLKRDINSVFNSVPAVLASRDAFNAINAQKEQAFAGYLPRVTL